jgi:hypothetical protein
VFRLAITAVILSLMLIATEAQGQGSFTLVAEPGAITGVLVGTDYVNTFGNINALGLGTPNTGLTVAQLTNGALYFSEFGVTFAGLPNGHKASLTAYVSTNFAHPAAQVVENCPSTATCTSSGGYSAFSTSAGAPSNVIASPGMGNATAIVGIGVFLPDNDGATAFTGADTSAVVTYTMTDLNTNHVLGTVTWTFNGTPSQTVQDALQLTLGTATGGLTVTTAADYSINFGNVNGLGISPGAGLATTTVATGTVYSTPYLLNVAFTDFTSTTATIKAYVSTNFAHPTTLALEDATASGGPFTAISTTAGTPTVLTTTAADRSSNTRYLGLLVNKQPATAFVGTDNATLTYTLTVP